MKTALWIIGGLLLFASPAMANGPSPGELVELTYYWVGIFPGDGVIFRAIPQSFINKYAMGEPFTWSTLREASASVCLEDAQKLKIEFKYHVVKPAWEKEGSEIIEPWPMIDVDQFSKWPVEAIRMSFQEVYLNKYLYPGGVYAISISRERIRVLLSSGECGGWIFGGPLAYKIVPLTKQRDLLVLGPLTAKRPFSSGEDETRFTMTSNGPRLFDKHDLDQPPRFLPFVRSYWWAVTPFFLLGGYFVLRGYYQGLGIRLQDLPPYASLREAFTYNFGFLLSWRSLVYPVIGTALYSMTCLLPFNIIASLLWGPIPVQIGNLQILSAIGIPLRWQIPIWAITAVLAWTLIYFLWARKWLPRGTGKLFIWAPVLSFAYSLVLACGLYFGSESESEQLLSILIGLYIGGLFITFFWMYLQGVREGSLIIAQPEKRICTVLRTDNMPLLKIVILGHLREYLIGLDPYSRAVSIIPTRNILAINPSTTGGQD